MFVVVASSLAEIACPIDMFNVFLHFFNDVINCFNFPCFFDLFRRVQCFPALFQCFQASMFSRQ